MTDFHYIFIESLRNTYEAGGVVMLPILLAGVIGFYFLFASWLRIGGDFFRRDIHHVVKRMQMDLSGENEQCEDVALKRLRKRSGFLSRELSYAMEIAQKNYDEFRDYMQVRMMKSMRYMEQGNHIIMVMAAAAPLLGLLGTVTGMVSTFEVITLYGNQSPVLMADGISEALISSPISDTSTQPCRISSFIRASTPRLSQGPTHWKAVRKTSPRIAPKTGRPQKGWSSSRSAPCRFGAPERVTTAPAIFPARRKRSS